MNDKTWLILKLILVSAALSAAIKYLAPSLHIPLTLTNVLIAILLPSIVMAILLLWRGQRRSPTEKDIEKDIN